MKEMDRTELIDKINKFCDSDNLEIKKQLKSEIHQYTSNNNVFITGIYLSSFNTMILAHFDAYILSKVKTSKSSILNFLERYQSM